MYNRENRREIEMENKKIIKKGRKEQKVLDVEKKGIAKGR